MTSSAQTASPNLSNPSGRWLFGPVPDLLLGCGVLYLLIIAAYAALGSELHDGQPKTLLRLLVILISMPHYGATLLRVYEERSERRSYALFSIGATAVVFGAFLVSLYNFYFASLMLTLYLTWSPWHYTGQNYGIAMMFARRGGLDVSPRAKRLLYASFVLSFVLTALVMHGIIAANFTPFDYTGGEVLFLPLGLPDAFTGIAIPAVAILYLGCLGAASALLLRSARPRDLVPIWAIALTQALWFAVPYWVVYVGTPTGIEPLDGRLRNLRDYSIWIVLGHAAQYLWITAFYARAGNRWSGYANYLGKAGITGIAIWTLPVIVFAPDALGRVAHDAGLAMVVASAVNLHHFILDGAIWKLRHMKIASVLIRGANSEQPASTEFDRRWIRKGVWVTAAASSIAAFFAFWQNDLAYHTAAARGDVHEASRILDRLAWVGRDHSKRRVALAQLADSAGQYATAVGQLERASELDPDNEVLQRAVQRSLKRLAEPRALRPNNGSLGD